ncbi:MAG: LuxR C-terminal-related transcriptional regulator [bacterium]
MSEQAASSGAQDGPEGAKRAHTGPLSKREREVFELLADGLSGAEIAERLVLSPETVRTHIRNAMAKLGASTRSHAVAIALRRGEIETMGESNASKPQPERRRSTDVRTRLSLSDLAGPLDGALEGLLSLWDVDAGWVFLADDDGLTLNRAAERVANRAETQPATLVLGEGTIGRAALERRSQILPAPGSDGGAMIVAPMLDGDRLIGVIGLATRSSRPTGRQELLLLQALAGRVGELIQTGGPRVAAGIDQALRGFRASWASATRSP